MKKNYIFTLFSLCFSVAIVRAQVTDIVTFKGTNGANPRGSLIRSGTMLYGTTSYGGANSRGSVFAVDTTGHYFKELVSFNGADSAQGSEPSGALLLVGTELYGLTQIGGAHGEGVLFSVDTSGANYKDLFDFGSPNAANVPGSLLLIGSKLYGVSLGGGSQGVGQIFSIDTSGTNYKDVFDFTSSTGHSIYGSITLVGNKFFGLTENGGTYDDGTIYSIDTSGAPSSYKTLISFWDNTYPQGNSAKGEVVYSNGKLYGMTLSGGANEKGVIFSVDTSGNNYKDMLDFSGTNGYAPYGSLILVDSLLYGMTYGGGIHNDGNIFSIDTSGKGYSDLVDFNGTDGENPFGSLIMSNGIFYGTLYTGGTNSDGAVFSTRLFNVATGIQPVHSTPALTLYPSPNDGRFTINGIANGQVVQLFNSTGKLLSAQTATSTTMHFDITNFANSLYLARVINPDGSPVKEIKLVKEN